MKFRKIVSIDNTGLEPWAKKKLSVLADEFVFYEDYPVGNSEIISRIGDSDCVLVSWNTPIEKEVIESCKNIKYIGMCCSLYDESSANVDIKTAHDNGINVLGISDYGDMGVVEFILSELIRLLHGFGDHLWKGYSMELSNQKLGIIGLGATGKLLAEKALAFDMDVFYFSRTRKPDFEQKGVKYLPLNDLLSEVDIISTHLPKKTKLLGKDEFERFGHGKILINTSLDPTFDIPSFEAWIRKDANYAIFDRVAMGSDFEKLKEFDGVIYSEIVSGWTKQAKMRLSEKVIENIYFYFDSF